MPPRRFAPRRRGRRSRASRRPASTIRWLVAARFLVERRREAAAPGRRRCGARSAATPVRLPFLFAGPEAAGGIDALAARARPRGRPRAHDARRGCSTTRRIVLCVGSGGVGKTTTAAALAVEAARRGRRTAVLTVDPAQRLKDALGLGALAHGRAACRVAAARARRRAHLDAMLLDVKRTFDELVLGARDDARAGAAHPREPALPEPLRRRSPAAPSTWPSRASTGSPRGRLRPPRRRHAAGAARRRLPRRAPPAPGAARLARLRHPEGPDEHPAGARARASRTRPDRRAARPRTLHRHRPGARDRRLRARHRGPDRRAARAGGAGRRAAAERRRRRSLLVTAPEPRLVDGDRASWSRALAGVGLARAAASS